MTLKPYAIIIYDLRKVLVAGSMNHAEMNCQNTATLL